MSTLETLKPSTPGSKCASEKLPAAQVRARRPLAPSRGTAGAEAPPPGARACAEALPQVCCGAERPGRLRGLEGIGSRCHHGGETGAGPGPAAGSSAAAALHRQAGSGLRLGAARTAGPRGGLGSRRTPRSGRGTRRGVAQAGARASRPLPLLPAVGGRAGGAAPAAVRGAGPGRRGPLRPGRLSGFRAGPGPHRGEASGGPAGGVGLSGDPGEGRPGAGRGGASVGAGRGVAEAGLGVPCCLGPRGQALPLSQLEMRWT